MIDRAPLQSVTSTRDFGGKAFGLAELSRCGARIPPTLCLRVHSLEGHDHWADVRSTVAGWGLDVGEVRWIVRSSSANEDTRLTSNAGLFSSRAFVSTVGGIGDAVKRALSELVNSGCDTYILQPYIAGQWSGVAFSTDPARLGIGDGLITYVRGDCESLVQGRITPAVMALDETAASSTSELAGAPAELRRIMRDLERRWNAPVDCEFTVDERGALWLLQARPVASVLREAEREPLTRVELGAALAPQILTHPKVALRLRCQEAGATISNGTIAMTTVWRPELTGSLPSATAYTSVLLHPRLIEGSVQRRFSVDGISGAQLVLDRAVSYWIRYAIIAEVLEPIFTGVTSMCGGEAVVEIARGHYVPKGLVPTSVYAVRDEQIECRRSAVQAFYFDIDFLSGGPIRRLIEGAPPRVDDLTLRRIAELGRRVGLTEEELLEFGVDGRGDCYVIDIQAGSSTAAVPAGTAVVSVGSAQGKLLVAAVVEDNAEEHYIALAAQFRAGAVGEPVIVAASAPQLGLVRYFADLAARHQTVVGVIFEIYSPLCHLALLLREWQIPAVAIDGFLESAKPSTHIRMSAGADGIVSVEEIVPSGETNN